MTYSTRSRKLVRGLVASGVMLGALAVGSAGGAFAQDGEDREPQGVAPTTAYALTLADDLLEFDVNEPNATTRTEITGLRGNETLVGIDFRPSSQVPEKQGDLYGVGNKGNIYTIDTETGAATRESQLVKADSTGAIIQPRERVALEGDSFGVDFNPTVDRLRIVSEDDQNLRVNVDTGATIEDGKLNYIDDNEGTAPWVTGVAYTNNVPSSFNTPPATGPGTTQLFDLDAGLDILAQQNPANEGDLTEIGDLGPNIKLNTGFDVNSFDSGSGSIQNTAYAALRRKSETKASGLFVVDLATGEATSNGRIDGPRTKIKGLAVPIGGGI